MSHLSLRPDSTERRAGNAALDTPRTTAHSPLVVARTLRDDFERLERQLGASAPNRARRTDATPATTGRERHTHQTHRTREQTDPQDADIRSLVERAEVQIATIRAQLAALDDGSSVVRRRRLILAAIPAAILGYAMVTWWSASGLHQVPVLTASPPQTIAPLEPQNGSSSAVETEPTDTVTLDPAGSALPTSGWTSARETARARRAGARPIASEAPTSSPQSGAASPADETLSLVPGAPSVSARLGDGLTPSSAEGSPTATPPTTAATPIIAPAAPMPIDPPALVVSPEVPQASPIPPPQPTRAGGADGSDTPGADRPPTSGVRREAVLVSRAQPSYPPLATRVGERGIVEVEFTIDTSGRVGRARALTGPPLLREAAERAVLEWRYLPALADGVPIESRRRVRMAFE